MDHDDSTAVPGMTVLRAAAFMAWADGRLAANELSAARGVATVLGLSGPGTEGPGLLARGPLMPSALAFDGLGRRQRELVYATAAWIAMADGILDVAERRALRILQRRLRLEPEVCDRVEELVYAYAGDDDWPRRYAGVLHEFA